MEGFGILLEMLSLKLIKNTLQTFDRLEVRVHFEDTRQRKATQRFSGILVVDQFDFDHMGQWRLAPKTTRTNIRDQNKGFGCVAGDRGWMDVAFEKNLLSIERNRFGSREIGCAGCAFQPGKLNSLVALRDFGVVNVDMPDGRCDQQTNTQNHSDSSDA